MIINPTAIQKIRDLQIAEGSKPCFRSGKIFCSYEENCCWAEICDFEMSRVHSAFTFNVVEGEK